MDPVERGFTRRRYVYCLLRWSTVSASGRRPSRGRGRTDWTPIFMDGRDMPLASKTTLRNQTKARKLRKVVKYTRIYKALQKLRRAGGAGSQPTISDAVQELAKKQ